MRRLLRHGLILMLLTAALLSVCAVCAQAEGGRVQGIVWNDRTADGLFSGEGGLSGVTVVLEKSGDTGIFTPVSRTVTTSTGDYALECAADGEYRVSFELPSGYCFTVHGQDSQALPAQGRYGRTVAFTVSGGASLTVNAGAVRNGCSASFVAFEDLNQNSGRMSTEPLIRDVSLEIVYVFDGTEYPVARATTDKDGQAVIRDLSPGTYIVRASLPGNFVIGPMGEKINSFYNCFHPNEDNSGYTDPFTLEDKGSVAMGVGLVRTGALTGSLWFDANADGQWNDGEGGLVEAEITLRSDSLGLSRTTHPDVAGKYSFSSLQPGDYRLEFTLPEGMIFTYPGASLITSIASKASLGVSVQVDVTTPLGAVGGMAASSFSLALYEDVNLNGSWDDLEPGLAGASVTAYQGGVKVDGAVSDLDGRVDFATLRSGETRFTVELPDGFLLTADEAGLFPFTGAQSSSEVTVILGGAEQDRLYTAAATQAAAIQGVLFEDPVNQGLYQEGDALLSGFTVQAVNAKGEIAAAAETQDGAYILYPLLPGSYTVRFLLNDPYVAALGTAETANIAGASRILTQNPDYGETDPIALTPGQAAADVNGAVFRAGTVDGAVTLEGVQGSGIRGVTVTLLDASGAPASDYSYGVTDETGAFLIKGVLPGEYTLSYAMPADAAFTQPMTDDDTVRSEPFTAESGCEIHMPALAGVYTSVLSGKVISLTEESVPVTITVQSQATEQSMQTVTGEDGKYRFAGLRPGAYTVSAELPEGMVFGSQPGGLFSMIADSFASTDIVFDLGDNRLGADILAAAPADLTGIVYYDADRSATREAEESGVEGRTLTLTGGSLSFSQTTDAEGRYAFTMLPPGEYTLSVPLEDNEVLVGIVPQEGSQGGVAVQAESGRTYDLPIMQYARIEGRFWSLDGTVSGVSGIDVTLLDVSGAAVAAAQTGASGEYAFDGLLPGDYTLSATLPEGYLFARAQDLGEKYSYIQSQPDGENAYTPIPVAMGDMLTGVDVGMGANGQIGDRAWLDENGNGLQDIAEPDMPGIVIELYQHGELVASTVTDMYGRYLLSDLYPGEYQMVVTMHAELKATVQNNDFPLLNSILPQEDGTKLIVQSVVVPSGDRNLHCDLGFELRKKGVYPDVMEEIHVKDWTPYSERKGE